MSAEELELERFLRGDIAAADFPHREHVRMAWLILARHEFTEAALHYAAALRRMTATAGRPEAFNLTVTLAFLALIAQRMAPRPPEDFASFAAAHGELFEPRLLERWYSREQLASPLARASFLLPAPRAGAQ